MLQFIYFDNPMFDKKLRFLHLELDFSGSMLHIQLCGEERAGEVKFPALHLLWEAQGSRPLHGPQPGGSGLIHKAEKTI